MNKKNKRRWLPKTDDERRLLCRAAQFVVHGRECGVKSLTAELDIAPALARNLQWWMEDHEVIEGCRNGPGRRKVLVPDLKALGRRFPPFAKLIIDDGNHTSPSPSPLPAARAPAPLPDEADVGSPDKGFAAPGISAKDLERLSGKLRQLLAAQRLVLGDTPGTKIIQETIVLFQKLVEERSH